LTFEKQFVILLASCSKEQFLFFKKMRSPDLSPEQRGEPTTEQVDASLRLPEPLGKHFYRTTKSMIDLMRERGSWQIPSGPLDRGVKLITLNWFLLCDLAVTSKQIFGETEELPDSRWLGLDYWDSFRKVLRVDDQEAMKILEGARRAFGKLAGRAERMKPYDTYKAEKLVKALLEFSANEDST
jgi:hypothetical protein